MDPTWSGALPDWRACEILVAHASSESEECGWESLLRGDSASFVERDYVTVGTQQGPDSALTLSPVVLKLHRPAL